MPSGSSAAFTACIASSVAALNASARPFGGPGQAADPAALQACAMVADDVVQFARWQQAAR